MGSNPAGDAMKHLMTGPTYKKRFAPSLVFEQIVSKSIFKTPFLSGLLCRELVHETRRIPYVLGYGVGVDV